LICLALETGSRVPIIMLTAKAEEHDILNGLETEPTTI
jgi:DNA-binding response OmpR family regulator